MKRRTLLQLAASAAAILPIERLRLLAQPRELTPEAVVTLREVAPTVLPGSLGAARIDAVVDKFVEWTRGYREGVPLAHGYGHPRLVRTKATPVPTYLAQLSALGNWKTLDVEGRRTLLESAFAKAGVKNLPSRPMGQHVVADLMAFYFRSSQANDYCYQSQISREICRPIQISTKKPEPLKL